MNVMATSSSSSSSSYSVICSRKPYDVFVAFRGSDTRKTFVDHLFAALDQRGIHAFKDLGVFSRGKSISPEIWKAIESSSIAVVVFSRNFANSTWCLTELERIMACRNSTGLIVFPVFYDVDPAEVRHQRGYLGKSLAELAPRFDDIRVNSWREALWEAANLYEFHVLSDYNGYEARCIKDMVDRIFHRLQTIKTNPDVFLSFRGEDTRRNFVDHLYSALSQKGIKTFKHVKGLEIDKELEKEESVDPEVLRAIEVSYVALVIFSENYAYSARCLDELLKIWECEKTMGLVVFPVFYNVNPSDVRSQEGCFKKGLAIHGMEKVEKWREALMEVASFSGWDLKSPQNWHEAECIKKIVETIWGELHIEVEERKRSIALQRTRY